MATTNGKEKGAFERIGCAISSRVSDVAANPLAQIGVIALCATWFALGLNTNVLTAVLSIMAITLTQMVLNRQIEREADAHRRDVAMHAKLDELLIASKQARNEMAGIEELEETEIEDLKEAAKEAAEAVEDEAAGTPERKAAEKLLVASEKLSATAERSAKKPGKARRQAAKR
jgi:low affinity Fe/Cu permease